MIGTDTLMTALDVVDGGAVSSNSQTSTFLPFIVQQEENLFRKCFGWSFYVALLADRICYKMDGTGDEQYVPFREGVAYAIDDYVLHEGRIYIATAITTGKERPSQESENPFWKVADRFTTPAFQFLWQRYLRNILSFAISQTSLNYRAIKDTPMGLTRRMDDGNRPANVRELGVLKSEYQNDLKIMIENMEMYIGENPTLFPEYKTIKEKCGTSSRCNTKRRMSGFNIG